MYNKYKNKTEKIQKELEEAKKVYQAMLDAGLNKDSKNIISNE